MLLLVLSLLLLFYRNLLITFDNVAVVIIILTEPITSVSVVIIVIILVPNPFVQYLVLSAKTHTYNEQRVVIVLSFYRNLSITFLNVIVIIIIILPKSSSYLTQNHIHGMAKVIIVLF